MNVLIIGCGRVGSNLAKTLCDKGHDVSIMDRRKSALEILDDSYTGLVFEGVPIDNDALINAGIDSCDVLCAVTDDDDVNLMVAQIAKEVHHVPIALTRVLNVEKDRVFSDFGLSTICPTNLTIEAMISAIDGYKDEQYLHYGNHTAKFFSMSVPADYIGSRCAEIQLEENELLYAIMSDNGNLTLVSDMNRILKEGDTLIFSKLVD